MVKALFFCLLSGFRRAGGHLPAAVFPAPHGPRLAPALAGMFMPLPVLGSCVVSRNQEYGSHCRMFNILNNNYNHLGSPWFLSKLTELTGEEVGLLQVNLCSLLFSHLESW